MPSHYDIIAEEKQNDSVDQIPVEDIETFFQRMATGKCSNDDCAWVSPLLKWQAEGVKLC